MTIAVEQLEGWIGSEARAESGDKLGKIDEVYFMGDEPVAIGVRSGLAGRKHHLASLDGARVSRDGVHLAIGEADLISTGGGPLTATQISALAAHDDRLRDLQPDDLEGWQQREERRKEAEEARARAEALEAEAQRRAEEELKATASADDAESAAEQARREREEAEARAREARMEAERVQQG